MTARPSAPPAICAVILAGGQGSRMGGIDKGLVLFQGRPLIAHVLERIIPQCGQLLISANRSQAEYERFGYPVLADIVPDQPGPLAGILTALESCSDELLLVVPCDTPRLPRDLVARLQQALDTSQAEIAVVSDGSRLQPTILLLRRSVKEELRRYLLAGERKVQLWLQRQPHVQVDFSDEAAGFANINTLQQLSELEQTRDH